MFSFKNSAWSSIFTFYSTNHFTLNGRGNNFCSLHPRWLRGVKGDRFTIMVVFMASLIQNACLSSSLHRYKTFWLLLIKINWSNKIVKHRIRTFSIHLVLTLSSLQHPPILATWDKTLIPFWLKKSCTYWTICPQNILRIHLSFFDLSKDINIFLSSSGANQS